MGKKIKQYETPREIYSKAIEERKSTDPLKRREACEKGWLAVVEAVDLFLKRNGLSVHKGSAEAHSERKFFLSRLASKNSNARKILKLTSEVSEYLHGVCFYEGKDSDYMDILLKETVLEIIELTEEKC